MNLSLIVPTYNEKENVAVLVKQVRRVLAAEGLDYEIVFMDDSTDDTPHVLERLQKEYPEVRYIHRENCRGLASAVVEGFAAAKGEYLIVMDADLQHPPEMIPLIAKRLSSADIVIPSRFVEGGSDGGLSTFRKLVSWTARSIGRLSIRRLRQISDCTGGYFGLKREVITGVKLEPIGWKILMEVLVKGKYETVHEIPYTFLARNDGHSKMGLKEQWNYLLHVAHLVKNSPEDMRFYSFCFVGALGVLVNMLSLTAFVRVLAWDALQASIAASVMALLHNYYLNSRVTWGDCQKPVIWRRALQLPQFMLVSAIGIGITAFVLQQFMLLGWNVYAGQLLGIGFATFWGYSANNRWTWARTVQTEETKLRVTQEYPHETS